LAAPFKSILCGVEGNDSSTIAAREAIALQTPETTLHFMAVYASFELGPDYTKGSLRAALEEARGMAAEAGVAATAEMPGDRYASNVLLAEGEKHDLLVIGTHNKSRAAGILLGGTASEATHRTERPLLISREPAGRNFLERILLASDGSEGSWAPARVAAALSATYGAELEAIHIEDGKHPDAGPVVEAQVEEIKQATGAEPELLKRSGHATEQIVEAAAERSSSLIVCGRRGLTGIKSLGSVSERVAHQAGSSVLLVPNG
jgi:nucleotide-binding universal stress UspA family protein